MSRTRMVRALGRAYKTCLWLCPDFPHQTSIAHILLLTISINMHLSYRDTYGFTEPTALGQLARAGVVASRAVASVVQRALEGSVQRQLENHGAAVVASEYGDQYSQQEQLYSMERELQLAYAVGDRQRIRTLEADLEAMTGWRFQHHRLWRDQ